MGEGSSRSRRWLRWLPVPIGLALMVSAWIWWAEGHPRDERRLRVLVHDQLDQWFPEAMTPADAWHGLIPRIQGSAHGDPARHRIVLVHGLDEPGDIWGDLITALGPAGYEVWEFRYPNDQGIDRSTDLLAELWAGLGSDRPVVLIGHSMGGLVIRDFVSRWRHPVNASVGVQGADVSGVILVGTPSQGSDWARLRIWLELRDHLAAGPERRFSLFAALRDGTGEAKIDLRPGSDFLADLNRRTWDESVRIALIGGVLTEPPKAMLDSLSAIANEVGSNDLGDALQNWWVDLGADLGDGVVPVASLQFPAAPSPILIGASHRGMLARFLPGEPEPPAIPYILAILDDWAKTAAD